MDNAGSRQPISLAAGARIVLRHAAAYAASALSTATPRIRATQPGDGPNAGSRHAAIYVAFDRWSLIADTVVAQLAALAQAGRAVTCIVNSPRLPPDAVARLRPYVSEIVHRRNTGHDFGAYKDGIARLAASAPEGLGGLHSLVLMNDSCYGPFSDLARIDNAAHAGGSDIFGITESWSHRYHLQTYYLRIGPRALRAPAFAAFWRSLLPALPRSLVILKGEIGFTQAMLKAGLTAGALCPYPEAARHALAAAERRLRNGEDMHKIERRYLEGLCEAVLSGHQLNPTHSFWDVLITECGAPFLKRELLRRNPLRIPRLAAWEEVVAGRPNGDAVAIRAHLKLG